MKSATSKPDGLREEVMLRKLEFYIALMGLRGEQRSAFNDLTALESFEARAHDLAKKWRENLRPRCGDNLLCRQHLAARELLGILSRGFDQPKWCALGAALSLALTDRAQEIVESLDRRQAGELREN